MKKIPNILCIIRIALIPFILLFALNNHVSALIEPWARWLISGIIFGLAMITDLFDGKIARKYDAITDLGKFLDPIADKLLVICIFIAFIELDLVLAIPVILIIAREFFVTGLRLAAASKGVVVAANYWGKAKTMTQGVSLGISFAAMLLSYLINENISSVLRIIPSVLSWVCAAITVISAISYWNQCKQYLK